MIATADSFTGQYASQTVFIEALLGRLKLIARERGWSGNRVFEARWIREDGQPDMAVITIEPADEGQASVDDVRAACKAWARRNKQGSLM